MKKVQTNEDATLPISITNTSRKLFSPYIQYPNKCDVVANLW